MPGFFKEALSEVRIMINNKVRKTSYLYTLTWDSSIELLDIEGEKGTIRAVQIDEHNNGVCDESYWRSAKERVREYLEESDCPGYMMIFMKNDWMQKETKKTIYRNDKLCLGLAMGLNIYAVVSADKEFESENSKNMWKTQLSLILESLIFSEYREGGEFTARKLLEETTLVIQHELDCLMVQKKLMLPFVEDQLEQKFNEVEKKEGTNFKKRVIGIVRNVTNSKFLERYFEKSPGEIGLREKTEVEDKMERVYEGFSVRVLDEELIDNNEIIDHEEFREPKKYKLEKNVPFQKTFSSSLEENMKLKEKFGHLKTPNNFELKRSEVGQHKCESKSEQAIQILNAEKTKKKIGVDLNDNQKECEKAEAAQNVKSLLKSFEELIGPQKKNRKTDGDDESESKTELESILTGETNFTDASSPRIEKSNELKNLFSVKKLSERKNLEHLVEPLLNLDVDANSETDAQELEKKYIRLDFFKKLFLDLELLQLLFPEPEKGHNANNSKDYDYYITKAKEECDQAMKIQKIVEEQFDGEEKFE